MRHIMDRIETELKLLDRELRIELPKEIARATALGDLRENAEYHAALDRQRYVQARSPTSTSAARSSRPCAWTRSPRPGGFRLGGHCARPRQRRGDGLRAGPRGRGDASQGRSPSPPRSAARSSTGAPARGHGRVPAGERTLAVIALTTLHEREEIAESGAANGRTPASTDPGDAAGQAGEPEA